MAVEADERGAFQDGWVKKVVEKVLNGKKKGCSSYR